MTSCHRFSKKRQAEIPAVLTHRLPFNIAPNLLEQNFIVEKPNQKWAGDISYIWTREGWLYLALAIVLGPVADNGSLLDLHLRRVIALRDLHANPFWVTAWAVSNRMKRDPLPGRRCLASARGALRSPPHGCSFHWCAAWGSQHCSHSPLGFEPTAPSMAHYQKILRQHGFQVSPLADVAIRCRAAEER